MFAVGQIPEGVQSTSFGFFLLFFYNQVLGLSGFLASLAIVLALLVDAVSDPVIGSWSAIVGGVGTRLCMLLLHPLRFVFTFCFRRLQDLPKRRSLSGWSCSLC